MLTLRPNQYEGDLLDVAELGHLGVVVVDGVEGGLILQAEHKNDRVHPGGELKKQNVCTVNPLMPKKYFCTSI